jgi:AbrB family looped-hinge helix DNA binding protein
MASATITSKGQITLPKPIRERLRVKPGDRVTFREHADGTVTVEANTLDLRDLRGSVRPRARGVSIQDMAEAIRQGAASRAR